MAAITKLKVCTVCNTMVGSAIDGENRLSRCPKCGSILVDIKSNFDNPSPDPDLWIKRFPPDNPKYKVIRKIGQGGFGSVYIVRRIGEDEEYFALKFPVIADVYLWTGRLGSVNLRTLKEQNDLIEREVRIYNKHRNPYFVDILDSGTLKVDGHEVHYYVSELGYINLDDLSHELYKLKKFELIYYLAYKIAQSTAYMHQEGLAVQDISPSNFVITVGKGGIPEIRNIDFGLITTKSSVIFGGRDRLLNPSINDKFQQDVFSLGVIMFEMLIGKVWTELEEDFKYRMTIRNTVPMFKEIVFEKHKDEIPNMRNKEHIIEILGRAVKSPPEYSNAQEFLKVLPEPSANVYGLKKLRIEFNFHSIIGLEGETKKFDRYFLDINRDDILRLDSIPQFVKTDPTYVLTPRSEVIRIINEFKLRNEDFKTLEIDVDRNFLNYLKFKLPSGGRIDFTFNVDTYFLVEKKEV